MAQALFIFRVTDNVAMVAQQLDIPLNIAKLAVCPLLRGQALTYSAFGVLAARDVTNALLERWLGYSRAQSLDIGPLRAQVVCLHNVGRFDELFEPFADRRAMETQRRDARWGRLRSEETFIVSVPFNEVWDGLKLAERRGARSLPVLEAFLQTLETDHWVAKSEEVKSMAPIEARLGCANRICGLMRSFWQGLAELGARAGARAVLRISLP